ncbi:hypothetical protein QBC35DRAFT_454489 [Podospora australis]|uniref:Uncharacterized protein n=1 Tax=Podospora australis TaxID=1536484 RepID=A0AAN6WN59_9PEZI|nr:hypothetical protein QBC35DRAFT_454489 [Podospora australis]
MASSAPTDESTPLLHGEGNEDRDEERDTPILINNPNHDDEPIGIRNKAPSSAGLLLAAILHLVTVLDAPIVVTLGALFSEHHREIPTENYINWANHIYAEFFNVIILCIFGVVWSAANLARLCLKRPPKLLGPAWVGMIGHGLWAFYFTVIVTDGLRAMMYRPDNYATCRYWDYRKGEMVPGPPECYAWLDKYTPSGWIYLGFLLVLTITQIILFIAYLVWTWRAVVSRNPSRSIRFSRGNGGGITGLVSNLRFPTGQMTVSFTVQFLGAKSLPSVSGSVVRSEGAAQPDPAQVEGSSGST